MFSNSKFFYVFHCCTPDHSFIIFCRWYLESFHLDFLASYVFVETLFKLIVCPLFFWYDWRLLISIWKKYFYFVMWFLVVGSVAMSALLTLIDYPPFIVFFGNVAFFWDILIHIFGLSDLLALIFSFLYIRKKLLNKTTPNTNRTSTAPTMTHQQL